MVNFTPLLYNVLFYISNPERFFSSLKNSMTILILIISYILIFYRNFELIFEFLALKGLLYVAETFALLSFWVFLYLIVIILIEENKKNLTLCQNNEKWTKNYIIFTCSLCGWLSISLSFLCISTLFRSLSQWIGESNFAPITQASRSVINVLFCFNYTFILLPIYHHWQNILSSFVYSSSVFIWLYLLVINFTISSKSFLLSTPFQTNQNVFYSTMYNISFHNFFSVKGCHLQEQTQWRLHSVRIWKNLWYFIISKRGVGCKLHQKMSGIFIGRGFYYLLISWNLQRICQQ